MLNWDSLGPWRIPWSIQQAQAPTVHWAFHQCSIQGRGRYSASRVIRGQSLLILCLNAKWLDLSKCFNFNKINPLIIFKRIDMANIICSFPRNLWHRTRTKRQGDSLLSLGGWRGMAQCEQAVVNWKILGPYKRMTNTLSSNCLGLGWSKTILD